MFIDTSGMTQLEDSAQLQPGDIVWLRYRIKSSWSWLKAAGVAKAESQIRSDGRFELLASNYIDDPGYVWFKVKVKDDPKRMYTAGINLGALITVAAVVAFYFVIVYAESYLVSRTPAGQEAVIIESQADAANIQSTADLKKGVGVAIPLLVLGGIYYLYKRGR